MQNANLKRRIIEISKAHNLSHLSSCLTAVDIIAEIFAIKKPDEKFVLDNGHAGLALYVVLENYDGSDAEKLLEVCGIHPDRLKACTGIDCSTGSLGQGLPIAVGMAMADRTKNVYCLVSDGGTNEGSFWEALRIAHDNNLTNLHIYINANGFGAYCEIDTDYLKRRIRAFRFPVHFRKTNVDEFDFLQGLKGHYVAMNEETYLEALKVIA